LPGRSIQPATQSSYCEPYFPGPNSFFQTSSEQNKTWTGTLGLNMTDVGFTGTAVTGYDTSAQINYNFANAKAENWVCGTDSFAPDASRTVVQPQT
jgi:hypothetical protein